MTKGKGKEKKGMCKCGHTKEAHYDNWGPRDYTGCAFLNCGCVDFEEAVSKPKGKGKE